MDPIQIALRDLMAARGMSVADLWVAADLGGPSGVYRYLKGDRGRRINSQAAETIEKIARALDVEPDFFIEYRAWRIGEIAREYPRLADQFYDALIALARSAGGKSIH